MYLKLRPRLFGRLTLRSRMDLQFLLDMFRSQRDGWLSNTVVYLEIVISDLRAPSSIDRMLQQLSRRLPRLTQMRFVPNDASLPSTKIPTRGPLTITPTSQPFLSCFVHMKSLTLQGFHVLSFSVLAHVLGELRSLETVELDEVSWTNKESDDRMPTQLAAFHRLHTIRAHNMPAPWTLMWLFAPLFERHCIHPDDRRPPHTNPDARLAILLTKTLLVHLDYAFYRKNLVMEYNTRTWSTIGVQRWDS